MEDIRIADMNELYAMPLDKLKFIYKQKEKNELA
jgi:hypothetical protein